MKVKGIVEEDFVNYKKPSMFIIFPSCNWKCDKECGRQVCQNGALASEPIIEIEVDEIIKRYINNPISKALVCGGLEPFDNFTNLFELVSRFREISDDDIVIYTGYKEIEIYDLVYLVLSKYKNIIIKFGRYIPDKEEIYDELLGVTLASNNQYARKIDEN